MSVSHYARVMAGVAAVAGVMLVAGCGSDERVTRTTTTEQTNLVPAAPPVGTTTTTTTERAVQ
jgi:hypothetical protein